METWQEYLVRKNKIIRSNEEKKEKPYSSRPKDFKEILVKAGLELLYRNTRRMRDKEFLHFIYTLSGAESLQDEKVLKDYP
ncbi:hypothetical protein ACFL35_21725 [Candidatus Riflebacteria bacterium]